MLTDKETYFEFLNHLQKTGTVNMRAAAPLLQDEFGLFSDSAHDVLQEWLQANDPR